METPKQKCRISKTGKQCDINTHMYVCLHVQILIFIYLKIVLLYIAPWGKRINIVWLKWFKSSIFKKILALSYQNEKISTRKYFLSKLNIIKKKILVFLIFLWRTWYLKTSQIIWCLVFSRFDGGFSK
jgi:hypothetical protein